MYLHGCWYKSTVTAGVKSNLNLGIHSSFVPEKSRKKFSQALALKKEVGLSKLLSFSFFRKRKHIEWGLDSLPNWIITLVLDEHSVLGEGKKGRIAEKPKRREEKK